MVECKEVISKMATKYAKSCDPLNQTLEKQADIRMGFIEGFNRALSTSDISDSLHIDFACYLTGHDRETVEQMYNDWRR